MNLGILRAGYYFLNWENYLKKYFSKQKTMKTLQIETICYVVILCILYIILDLPAPFVFVYKNCMCLKSLHRKLPWHPWKPPSTIYEQTICTYYPVYTRESISKKINTILSLDSSIVLYYYITRSFMCLEGAQ